MRFLNLKFYLSVRRIILTGRVKHTIDLRFRNIKLRYLNLILHR